MRVLRCSWYAQVDLLSTITDSLVALGKQGEISEPVHASLPADVARDVDRLCPKLTEYLDEPHFKVGKARASAGSTCCLFRGT